MTRKEFIRFFLKEVLRSILFLFAGAFCISFFYHALFKSGNERNAMILLTSLAFIYVLLYTIGRFFHKTMEKLTAEIPAFYRLALNRIIQIISPFVFVFLIHISFEEDRIWTLIVLALLLAEFLIDQRKRQVG